MVDRHLRHGDVSVEEIARAAKGRFVILRDRPFAYAVGAVEVILAEIRTEDGVGAGEERTASLSKEEVQDEYVQ